MQICLWTARGVWCLGASPLVPALKVGVCPPPAEQELAGLSVATEDDTELSVASGIKCKDLPALGVSPWTANATDAGFELRECENSTDVCASYCVSVQQVRGGHEGRREREKEREIAC